MQRKIVQRALAGVAMIPHGRTLHMCNLGKSMEWATASNAPRNSFVTVVAWIYIVLEGLTAFVLVLQNLLINVIFPFDQFQEAMARADAKMAMPPAFTWMFGHLRLVLGLCLAVAAALSVGFYGLVVLYQHSR